MTRQARWAGFAAGALQILTGGMHSIAGWPVLVEQLTGMGVARDVLNGLAMPWHFTGAGLVVLGIATIMTCRSAPSRLLLTTVSGVNLLAALVSTVVAGPQSAHLIFVIPGVLSALAALGAGSEG